MVALWSSPAVAAVPEAQRPGILRIVGAQITWRSTAAAATLAPISLAPASVFKLQKSPDTKPDVKLRLVMGDEKGAPAYVFEFLGSSARANRDVLIEHHRVCTAPDAVSLSNAVPNPSPSPNPSAAPTKSASPVVGNVEERLAAGGSAIRKGANIGSNPLAGIEDPMILKERALASSSALRSQYQSLVNENGGIISDAAFWEGHRADLVRVALSKPKASENQSSSYALPFSRTPLLLFLSGHDRTLAPPLLPCLLLLRRRRSGCRLKCQTICAPRTAA